VIRLEAAAGALEAAWFGKAPEAAPSFVLLHEGLGCVAAWRNFPDRLSSETGWGAFTYSRLGYGGSDPAPLPRPLGYLRNEAALLPAILDQAGIRRCILVGHSDRGTIAALHATSGADPRVIGLVLIAPHFMAEEATRRGVRAAADAYNEGDLAQRLRRRHGANTDTAFEGWRGLWLDPRFRRFEVGDGLADVSLPLLMIQGLNDAYGTMAQVEYLRARVPHARQLLLEGCGHIPHLERQAEVLAAIADFAAAVQGALPSP
jgi:pimeloyl-ACP methyl ester carboxylesterase